MSLKTEIRQTVAEHLKSNTMGQARFARAVGVGAGAINQLLKGKGRKPTVAIVLALDAYFEKAGAWVTAYDVDKKRRRRDGYRLTDARVYALTEYADKKEPF